MCVSTEHAAVAATAVHTRKYVISVLKAKPNEDDENERRYGTVYLREENK